MSPLPEVVVFRATPVQDRLWAAVETPGVRIIGFGGAIRGTKTWGTLATLLLLARIYPRSKWHVIRRDLERLKDSTIPSFEKLTERFGNFVGKLNRSDWFVKCRNGSEIHFAGENIDRDPTLARFHGFETNGFLLDDGDELSERTLVKCIERAGTWIVPDGVQPPPYVFATFNPCAGWPRRRFYQPWRDQVLAAPYVFIPSTSADNPYVSDEQREAWKEMPKAEYDRYVIGDWESLPGGYYDTVGVDMLIDRKDLPEKLPDHWRYWGSYDWGYAHWSVMGAWCTDEEGTDYLLDTIWLRRRQDDELAKAYAEDIDPRCLALVYSGHDVRNVVKAHGASAESVEEVFRRARINLVLGDIDKVNGGRAVNRQVKAKRVKIVRTAGNLRVFDQLTEIIADPDDVRKPLKVDADPVTGLGGDDGADMFRYGIATRVRAAQLPESPPSKEAHHARRLIVKDGKIVEPEREPTTIEEMERWIAKRQSPQRTYIPVRPRVPRGNWR